MKHLFLLSLLMGQFAFANNETLVVKCKNPDKRKNVIGFHFTIADNSVSGWMTVNKEKLLGMPEGKVFIGNDESENVVLYNKTLVRVGQWITFKLGWSDLYDFQVVIVNSGGEGSAAILTDSDGAPYSDRFECDVK